jgi:hypothetical protein
MACQMAVALKKQKPGLYADGDGLYLQVTGSGGSSWIFRYMINGKRRDMGLGPLSAFALADARAMAADCRKLSQARDKGGMLPNDPRPPRHRTDPSPPSLSPTDRRLNHSALRPDRSSVPEG